MKTSGLLLIAILASFCSKGQTLPAKFSRVPVVSGIAAPTSMAFAPDGRIFITDQGGTLYVVKNGSLLPTPFIQLSVDPTGERGLLGIAFDPNFTSNGFIYLYYTVPTAPIHNRISRFTANGDVVIPGSEQIILELDNLSTATNHNGGSLLFGPDGKLFASVGENANGAHAQDPDTYHGKLLRMNSDGSVPTGNPFATGSEPKKRTWALGLRNPFTFSIQPGTGRLFVNDVGQNSKEEVNDATSGGLNFGWPFVEGSSVNPAYTNPVFEYDHGSGDGKGCAITGGTFYGPSVTQYPGKYAGKYFYLDLCNNWINYIDVSGAQPVRFPFATDIGGFSVSLTIGPEGNLYYLSRQDAKLYKITYDSVAVPVIQTHPANRTVLQGEQASFTISATGIPTVTYQWQKNNVNINGATHSALNFSSAQSSDAATYRVVVSNSLGSATSNNATLVVQVVLGVGDDESSLSLYPSPASDWLYVRDTRYETTSLEIWDTLGRATRLVQMERVSPDVMAVDIHTLTPGIYVMHIQSNAGHATRKFLVQ